MHSEPSKYKVVTVYESPYPDPIIFQKGEALEVGKEYTEDPDWKDWLWCTGLQNNEAWVPKQFIDHQGNEGIMLKDYNALELSVSVGETLLVEEVINGFAMAKKTDGTKGWVPMRNLEQIDAEA